MKLLPQLGDSSLPSRFICLAGITFSVVSFAVWGRQWLNYAEQPLLYSEIGVLFSLGGLYSLFRAIESQCRQITKTKSSLDSSEERFRDFAMIASDWLWETDENHRFTFSTCSSGHIEAQRDAPKEVIGRTRIEIADDATREPDKWRQHQARLDQREPFYNFTYAAIAANGKECIVSVSGKPIFTHSGRFAGYRGTARNVTAEVLAERRLLEAKAEAEAADLAKSQFLASMSHELRTPLNAIIGFSEVLSADIFGTLPAQQSHYVDLIHQSGRHLLCIINDILDLARVESGRFDLHDEPVEPRRLADACLAIVAGEAAAGGIDLSVTIEPAMPYFAADLTRLKQVLLNLLSNAVKFTKEDGAVTLSIRRGREGTVELEVRDTGAGMTEAEIAVALQPFGQVDSGLTRHHSGTGLGLPLAQRLTELHGGTLHVKSEKGRGTSVVVSLPASRVVAEPAPAPTNPLSSSRATATQPARTDPSPLGAPVPA